MTSLRLALLLTGLVLSSNAQSVLIGTPVYSMMDIYRAGGYNDGSDGGSPAVYTFAAKPGQTLIFASITGSWTCSYGVPRNDADGPTENNCYHPSGAIWANPIGPFSGYQSANFAGALVGVFLEDTLPTQPPPTLVFIRGNPQADGQISTDFRGLRPMIGQIFFIGDGLTGTGKGLRQVFFVPRTATHLYLGYIDGCAPPGTIGIPGCYYDNRGVLTAVFGIFGRH